MRKYKIEVIGHLLKNNKMAKFGDIVDESQLTTHPEYLVKDGFISEVKESVKDAEIGEKEEVSEVKESVKETIKKEVKSGAKK